MSKELVVQSTAKASLPAAISSGNLPAPIKNGIIDILTAFAGASQEDNDKQRLLRIYGEAVAGLDGHAAGYALQWLKLNNPRNPFRPTPQDVYECADRVMKVWRERVVGHFYGTVKWGQTESHLMLMGKKQFAWGPEPFTEGCFIPREFVEKILRDWLAYGSDRIHDLARMGRERLALIPSHCFYDADQLPKALQKIEDAEKEQQVRQEKAAYINSLPVDLQRHRAMILHKYGWKSIDEEEVIRLAKELIEQEKREAERRAEYHKEEMARDAAYEKPDVQEALAALRETLSGSRSVDRTEAIQNYVNVLAKYGARPHPAIAVEALQAKA